MSRHEQDLNAAYWAVRREMEERAAAHSHAGALLIWGAILGLVGLAVALAMFFGHLP